MGIAIPQVVTEDRASGALVIDGSLYFDKDKLNHLKRTPSSSGNRNNWTISCWTKRDKIGVANQRIFESGTTAIRFGADNFQWIDGGSGNNGENSPAAVLRDTGWYHLVFAWDSSTGVYGNRIYVNGAELPYNQTGGGNPSGNSAWNTGSAVHTIGANQGNTDRYYGGHMAQCYFVDGLTLDPGYFGYTDPLTGVWRPKKFRAVGTTVNNGTNWSAGLTGTANGSGLIGEMFDGNLSSGSWSDSSGYSVAFPGGVKATNSIKIYGGSGSANWFVVIDGVKTTINAPGGAAPAWSASGVTGYVDLGPGTLTTIGTEGAGIAQNGEVSGIQIDGVIMRDSTTQNLDFGTNGFYLPMDGNTPVGEDQSGKGNDWRPINFGGTTSIEKSTGAKPILNTCNGGRNPSPGVFGSKAGATYTTTSASNSGGKYVFEDLGTQPTFSFVRGATYVFDWSASSGHPLRFATAADAAGSTEYTDGTNVSGNVTKITVPHNAPDTLYYYCNVHNGMGNSISVTTNESLADPYAWKCVFAAPLMGNDDDVSYQINATSTAKSTTPANNAVASDASYNFYGGSYYFDGTGDDIDATITALGTRDFTLECWNETTATSALHTVFEYGDHTSNGFIIETTGTSSPSPITMFARDTTSGSAIDIANATYSSRYAIGRGWHHIALQRASNVATLFVDGIRVGTATWNSNYTSTNLRIGNATYSAGSGEGMLGYIQDVRLYDGIAKYSASADGEQAFIVPETDPDVLPDSPDGVAVKSNLKKITDGSVHFDGTSDSLTLATSSDLNLDGDFTMEFFIYNRRLVADTADPGILTFPTDGSNETQIYVRLHDVSYTLYKGGIILSSSAGAPLLHKWQHVAFTRSGQSIRVFVDGKLQNSTSNNDTFGGTTGTFRIGSYSGNTGDTDCAISNVRILKGTALYTADFAPPTAPLTNVTNTKLLTCQSTITDRPTIAQSDGGLPIYNTDATGTSITSGTRTDSDSANIDIALPLNGSNNGTTFTDVSDTIRGSGSAGTVTRTGVITTTLNSFFYGSSAYFDGANDHLEIPFPAINATEPWTIEWMQYQLGSIPNPCQICCSSGSSFITIGTEGTENIGFNWRNSAWSNANRFFSPSSTVAVPGGVSGRWVHIVFQRNSNRTISVFADGTLLQTSTNTYEASLGSGSDTGGTLRIGNNFSTYWFPGYIQDLRVYSGVAKYGSSDFTAPTSSIHPSTVSPSVVVSRGTPYTSNFNPFNDEIDTIRGESGRYATLNPLKKTPNLTVSEGYLKVGPQSNTWNAISSTLGMTNGKYYFEVAPSNYQYTYAGVANAVSTCFNANGSYVGQTSNDWGCLSSSGDLVHETATIKTGKLAHTGDIMGVTFDCATKEAGWYVNGELQYKHKLSGPYPFFFATGSYNSSHVVNFGQKPFKFPPPPGYGPLTTTANRPDTIVSRPDQYVGVTTYMGNGGTQQIDYGFQPDLILGKARSAASGGGWNWVDSVRGNKYIASQTNNNQSDFTGGNGVTFNSKGTLLVDTTNGDWNLNGNAGGTYSGSTGYVYYGFKAGGNKGTFNIDGADMGSAANAGMSAGALNSTAYNETQNWSTGGGDGLYGSSTWAPTFDGSPATTGSDVAQSAYVTNNGKSTVRFSPISGVIEVRVCQGSNSASTGTSRPIVTLSNGDSLRVNGANNAPTNHSFGYVSNITSITIAGTSAQGMNLLSVKLDGKLLVDTSANPPNAPSAANTACSVNTKQGFSIIRYTGNNAARTIAHGLSQAPTFWIYKNLTDNSSNWPVNYTFKDDAMRYMYLNQFAAEASNSGSNWGIWPTKDLLYVGADNDTNGDGDDHILYLWHDVPGVQKFGSFVGNAAVDGNYIELGFRPALIWVKALYSVDAGSAQVSQTGWYVYDNERGAINPNGNVLGLNNAFVEQNSSSDVDFLSNGFKIRNNRAINTSSGAIYCAWAEQPASNLYGATSNAV